MEGTGLEVLAGDLHPLAQVLHVFGPFEEHVHPDVVLDLIVLDSRTQVLQLQYKFAKVVLVWIFALPVFKTEHKGTLVHLLGQDAGTRLFVPDVLRIVEVNAPDHVFILAALIQIVLCRYYLTHATGLGRPPLDGIPWLLNLLQEE